MMRLLCLLFLFYTLAPARVCAQAVPPQTGPSRPAWSRAYDTVRPTATVFIVGKAGKMGVATRTGHLLTRLDYDTIYNFREGMAVVGRGHREVNPFGKVLSDVKYGYINQAGRLVVPMQYASINDFSDGFGLAESGRGYFYHNRQGKLVLHPRPVYTCDPFRGNLAYVEVPEQGFWLLPIRTDEITAATPNCTTWTEKQSTATTSTERAGC